MRKTKAAAIFLLLVISTLNIVSLSKATLPSMQEDVDPTVDLSIKVEIKRVRTINISIGEAPSFMAKVIVDSKEWESNIVSGFDVMDVGSAIFNVPDDEEEVGITIQVFKNGVEGDISGNGKSVSIVYNPLNGTWDGDDYLKDENGYGHASGTEDGKYGEDDCEIWFDVVENDYDGDGIPYWVETNVYHTDPMKDNRGEDADGDGVPIEWEWKWGHYFAWNWWSGKVEDVWFYSPLTWENHSSIDEDEDALSNYEEYLTSQWGSDPFRQDLFIELDQMKAGPNGEPASLLPNGSKEILRTVYDKHNIVYHLDDGCMGGGEMIPFAKEISGRALRETYYDKYFLHYGENEWRRGVFHYSLVVYDAGFNGYNIRRDEFQISSKYIEKKCRQLFFVDRNVVYASVFMHETGHSLAIWNPGVDDPDTMYPWKFDYWKYRPYKSCMNYGYTYILVDYSDGSHGMNDFDDWHDLDLTYFDYSNQ